MSVYVMIQWSVPEGEEGPVEAALAHVRDHIAVDHPAIRSTRMLRQFAGPLPHRAYVWLEEYESLSALEAQQWTAACDDVWASGPTRTGPCGSKVTTADRAVALHSRVRALDP